MLGPPNPTPIYRIVQICNLGSIIQMGGLYSPNHWPATAPPYTQSHNTQVQQQRALWPVSAGPGGVLADYVPFYFGYLSPMLLNLHTGRVRGYVGNQQTWVYLQTDAQSVASAGLPFAFSDGHGLSLLSSWFGNLTDLANVDWSVVYLRYWSDIPVDPDRQRRKQAEFVVHTTLPWGFVQEVGVYSATQQAQVKQIFGQYQNVTMPPVVARQDWYYR